MSEPLPSPAEREALLPGPRASVLAQVRQQREPATVVELAEACGLHRNTVARHLDALVAAGLVVRSADSGGRPGRPVGRYRAAPPTPGAGEFVELASLLARRVPVSHDGGLLARRLGERWAEDIVEREEQGSGRNAVSLLAGMGFDPEVSEDGHELRLRGCPLLPEKHEDAAVCAMHASMLRSLLAADGLATDDVVVVPFAEAGCCRIQVGPDPLLPPQAPATT